MKSVPVLAMMGLSSLFSSSTAFAEAQKPTGFYASLNAGVAALGGTDVTYYDERGAFGGTTGAEDTLATRFDFKSAATFGGVIGYDFGTIRTDAEISYARNAVRSFTLTAVNGSPQTLTAANRQALCSYLDLAPCEGSGNSFAVNGSRLRQLNAMANLWLDLPIGPVTPYVGGGVGISGFEIDGEGKGKFGWQLGAGASVKLTERLALTANYRHRQVSNSSIAYDNVSGVRLNKLKTNSFTAGLTVYF